MSDNTELNLSEDYVEVDISSEEWREIHVGDITIRIEKPLKLVYRKGGSTHRVINEAGKTYCYAAPETGKSVISLQAKEGEPAVVA